MRGEAAGPGSGGDADRDDRESALRRLEREVVACRRCPRLVEWRERVAEEKRAAFQDETYWGRPVPGFGDPRAWLLVVGLAPAAHGANRTGRMFTGDRSGKWLYRALHRAGFANQPSYREKDDGLELDGAYVTAAVRCAPPKNRPRPSERKKCRSYLEREVDALLGGLRGVVALGGYAYAHVLRIFRDRGWNVPSPMPDFGHGLELALTLPGTGMNLNTNSDSRPKEGVEAGSTPPGGSETPNPASGGGADATAGGAPNDGPGRSPTLLCSYHPSQQNTFTGTLTEEMFDAVWARARALDPTR